jgi:hypothetical protein
MTEPAADVSATPAPPESAAAPVTIVIVTEEPLKSIDVDKILALHDGEPTSYRVLVPADTQRNVLASFLNHLSLFEMREALESLRPVDRE